MNQNLSKRTQLSVLTIATAAGTSTINSSSVDMSGANGVMFVGSFGTANAGNTVHVQESDDNSTWANVAGTEAVQTTNNNLWVIDINRPLKRYARVVHTRGVSTTINPTTAQRYDPMKMSTALSSTVDVIVTLASPVAGTP